MAENKKVPIGVWIFWSIVGVLIIIRLIPWNLVSGNTIGLVVNLISALATVGAAGAAFLAVREVRGQQKEGQINRRPYFSYIEGSMGKVLDDESQYGESERVQIECRNVGIDPARDLTATVIILMPTDDGFIHPETIISRPVNDIAASFNLDVDRGGLALFDSTQHHYVILELDYYDAIYGFRFSQTFYLQWNGLDPFSKAGESNPLYSITREAKPYVLSMLRDL